MTLLELFLALVLLSLPEVLRRFQARKALRRAEEGLKEASLARGEGARLLLAYWTREREEEAQCAGSFELRRPPGGAGRKVEA